LNAERLWLNLEETHEVTNEITRYYITVGQLEKQLESSKESDDIEAEISKAIESAQSYLKAKSKKFTVDELLVIFAECKQFA
jgi:CII-binding regulator of phage lambda lysogenization HflD